MRLAPVVKSSRPLLILKAVENVVALGPGSAEDALEVHLVLVVGMAWAGLAGTASVLRSLVDIECRWDRISDCPWVDLDTSAFATSYLASFHAHSLALH